MRLISRDIDEYTLAAYLSGKLTPRRRREVARILAHNEDALDLVLTARELMDVSGDGAGPRLSLSERQLTTSRIRSAFLIAAVGVLVIAVAATTLMAIRFRSEVQHLRSTPAPLEDAGWGVAVAVAGGELRWDAVPDAVSYRVVIWNPVTGDEVHRGVVLDLRYALDESTLDLASTPRSVWVDALDADGFPLRRTRAIQLAQLD